MLFIYSSILTNMLVSPPKTKLIVRSNSWSQLRMQFSWLINFLMDNKMASTLRVYLTYTESDKLFLRQIYIFKIVSWIRLFYIHVCWGCSTLMKMYTSLFLYTEILNLCLLMHLCMLFNDIMLAAPIHHLSCEKFWT